MAKYSEDTLPAPGIVPWWVQVMQLRLTDAFKQKGGATILKLSAELGHYVADAHVPLHASSNHNGQYTGQQGIHGFLESRIPELLAEKELPQHFPPDQKYAFENRNGKIVRQYSPVYSKAYNSLLKGMIERRMQQSIYATASLWYTAWVDAGQSHLAALTNAKFTAGGFKRI